MTVNLTKIRVGAPDLMIIDAAGSTPVDLGASTGGATLSYAPTYFAPDIDQSTLPVYVARTKEEISFKANIPQVSALLLVTAFSLPGTNKVTTAAGTLGTSPTATLVVNAGGASGAYSYQVVPYTNAGDGVPATATSTAVGPTVLSAVNSITISWASVPAGANGVKIVRTAAQGAQGTGLLAVIPGTQLPGSWTDTGAIAPTAYTPSGTAPATPNQDTVSFGGSVYVPGHTIDWAVPKNDNTTNHWLGHLYNVYSGKSIALDYSKTKETALTTLELIALANLAQPQGQQAGYLIEQY
jgi:hypothetical protein